MIKGCRTAKNLDWVTSMEQQTMLDRRHWWKAMLFVVSTILAVSSLGAANGQSAAERAVEAAKRYSGTTITITSEAGLQSLDPLNFSGTMWEKLTGIKIKVVEIPINEMFTKTMQEYRARTGAYDALNVIPSWMPDLV